MSNPRQFSPKNWARVPAPALVGIEPAAQEAAFRAVVRGERPPKGLPPADKGADAVFLRPADVAEGIINLKSDPTALSEWANFILATCDACKLRSADCDYWDRLLSGIWEIALETRAKDPLVALAYAVRARQSLAGTRRG